jgi:hypothetical protein
MDVTYRRDSTLSMWLPARMTEEYQGPISRLNKAPVQGTARATAVYSDYKSFETGARIVGPNR